VMVNYCYSIVKSYFTKNDKFDSFNFLRSFGLLMFFGLTSLINIILFPFDLGKETIFFSAFIAILILVLHFIFPGYKCQESFLMKSRSHINVLFSLFCAVVIIITLISFYLMSVRY
jgi:hypothetical protein